MTATVPLIHVVDDDQSYLSATCRLLKAAGYAVRRYRSAAEFLDERQPGVPLTLRQVDPLIRDLTHYRDVIARLTTGATP